LTSGRHRSYYDTEPKVEQSKRLPTKVKALIPREKTMNELFTTLSVEQEEALSGGRLVIRDLILSTRSSFASQITFNSFVAVEEISAQETVIIEESLDLSFRDLEQE
jgi:hypothetical protein